MMLSNKITIIGVVSFLFAIAASIYFYQERTVFLDISFHLFYILKDQSFAIQNYRFAAFFTQLFPLFGSSIGLSLKSISILYSVSFVILPAFVFGVVVGWYKNYKVGAAYLIYLLLIVTHTFFWIQSELPQGMAFVFLFIATLEYLYHREYVKKWAYTIILLLLILIVFSHPLVVFPIGFVGGYYFIHYKNKKSLTIKVFGLFAVIYFVKSHWFKTGYDSSAMGTVFNYTFHWSEFIRLISLKRFVEFVTHDYYWWFICFSILQVWYVYHKEYLKGIWVTLFSFLLIAIISITYPNGAEQFYLENQYQLLVFFIVIPLVNDFFEKYNYRWLIYFLVVIQVFFLMRIWKVSTLYQSRLTIYKKILATTANDPNKKIIYPISEFPKETLLMDWASSYEFWLLSTVETGETRSIIIAYQEDEFDYALSNNHCFITKWGIIDYNELNAPYFIFKDSTFYVKNSSIGL
jgi:hypothetical protein